MKAQDGRTGGKKGPECSDTYKTHKTFILLRQLLPEYSLVKSHRRRAILGQLLGPGLRLIETGSPAAGDVCPWERRQLQTGVTCTGSCPQRDSGTSAPLDTPHHKNVDFQQRCSNLRASRDLRSLSHLTKESYFEMKIFVAPKGWITYK